MLAVGAGGDKCATVLGYLAAIMEFRKANYKHINKQPVYKNMCGISAGAIVCARLIQFADDPDRFSQAIDDLFKSLCDTPLVDRWNHFGSFFNAIESVLFHGSLYKNNLNTKIRNMLGCAGGSIYKDIYKNHSLSIGVWNLGKMEYNTITNPIDVALAVTASASVPFVFEPVNLQDTNGMDQQYVDGGLGHVIPVVEIIEWCESLQNNTTRTKEYLDIMVCYPIDEASFRKSTVSLGSSKLINDGQLSLYGVVWQNLRNDLAVLNKYFSTNNRIINIDNDRHFKKIIQCKNSNVVELFVTVFVPSEGHFSDFINVNIDALHRMQQNGREVANAILRGTYKQPLRM